MPIAPRSPLGPVLALSAAASGCSLFGSDDAPEATTDSEMQNIFAEIDAELAEAKQEVTTRPREPVALVVDEGTVTVTMVLAGKPVEHTLKVEQASLRVGDLPSLQPVFGHVKVDSGTWAGPEDRWTRGFYDAILLQGDAPALAFADVQSVTGLSDALLDAGDEATGTALLAIQLGERRTEVEGRFAATRLEGEGLHLRSAAPLELDPDDLGLEDAWARLPDAMGLRAVGDTVTLALDLRLEAFDGDVLPTFTRPGVTVRSVADFAREVEMSVDDYDAMKHRLGYAADERAEGLITREQFEQVRPIIDKYERIQEEAARRGPSPADRLGSSERGVDPRNPLFGGGVSLEAMREAGMVSPEEDARRSMGRGYVVPQTPAE